MQGQASDVLCGSLVEVRLAIKLVVKEVEDVKVVDELNLAELELDEH